MVPLESYDGEERQREVAEFRKATKQLGMQTALAELIGWCDELIDRCSGHPSGGDYLKQLKTDFETTLKNYMKRHDNEE